MKIAKVILVIVISGSFIAATAAYKVSKILIRYYIPNTYNKVCDVPLNIAYTTNPLDASGALTTFYQSITTISGAPCVAQVFYQAQ